MNQKRKRSRIPPKERRLLRHGNEGPAQGLYDRPAGVQGPNRIGHLEVALGGGSATSWNSRTLETELVRLRALSLARRRRAPAPPRDRAPTGARWVSLNRPRRACDGCPERPS